MDQTQLNRFEGLCADMYSASSPQARKVAHDTLMPLLNQMESIPQLEFVLGNSLNPHALLFASNGLIQLITTYWPSVSENQRLDIKQFLMSYLAQRCNVMYQNPLTEQALSFMIRLLCRVVKLAWLDGPKYQSFTSEVESLIESGSTFHAILALDIYAALTAEMQPTKGPHMARYRRTAMSFRDISLASVFQTGMKILKNLFQGKLNISDKAEESRLVHKVLKVVVGSLSFDFMGTMPDETADDQATVMVPYTWTNVKDLSYPGLFFDLYMTCVSAGRKTCAILCLQALVLFASLRRSLYSKPEEREAMLASYISGTSRILLAGAGLDDPECYHEFCRLLGRVNAANQLTELSSNPQFAMWIDQVFSFTSGALKQLDRLPNSMHYLLGFWTVLVPPVSSLGSRAPDQVRQYLEQVLKLYLEGRLTLSVSDDDESGNPLEDETLLFEQLDVVTSLSKLFLTTAFNTVIGGLEHASDERKIVWVVYLLGAIMAGQIESIGRRTRTASSDNDDDDGMTSSNQSISREYATMGEMVKRVATLMAQSDQQSRVSEELELSYLYFLDQFRKVYLAEHAKITSLVTPRSEGTTKLCSAVGVASDSDLMDIFVRKIFGNFQGRKSMEQVVKKTLGFANDFIAGTNTIYLDDGRGGSSTVTSALLDNERMKYILSHHENVDFGRIDKNYNTVYYSIIFKLTFAAKPPVVNWDYFNSIFAKIQQNGIQTRTAEQARLIVTLARNLKGASLAANTPETYNLLFKYLVDNPKTPISCKIVLFSTAADVWWDEPQVVVPILKFIADFAENRSQRVSFDNNSPNGVLLFRESVKVLSAYGQRMLQRASNHQYRDIYDEKYKGIGASLLLFTNTLGGGYANLGVFELYGDSSLSVAMSTALGLCLSVPLNDLSAFIKSLKSVYTFIEIVSKSHMSSMLSLGPSKVAVILKALEDGLTSFETAISLSCCNSIDLICSYLIETKEGSDEVLAIQAIVNNSEVRSSLSRIMYLLNHLAMSGDFASTWSLSRPLLGVVLLAKNEFIQMRASIIQQQINPERLALVETAYNNLMKGVDDNLQTKNREQFTKNLYQFGIDLRNK